MSKQVHPLWQYRVCKAIVEVEAVPHPDSCSDWQEDECTCGIQDALQALWPVVGASTDHGEVPDGHALQVARREAQQSNDKDQSNDN